MVTRGAGSLIVIGGKEDTSGERAVLGAIAERAGSGPLVVATLASTAPQEQWKRYRKVFARLGVRSLRHLEIGSREHAFDERTAATLSDAETLFLTGGDQLRITTLVGGTPLERAIFELHSRGAMIAGTSAGASVLTDTMIASGADGTSPRIGGAFRMAPGLGLLRNAVIDQHFAERGRVGRLIGAVAENPRVLGIGIDEDTAAIVECGRLSVLGAGAVYVVDGRETTYTNLADELEGRAVSVFGSTLHVLSQGDAFDLHTRRPEARRAVCAERREGMAGGV